MARVGMQPEIAVAISHRDDDGMALRSGNAIGCPVAHCASAIHVVEQRDATFPGQDGMEANSLIGRIGCDAVETQAQTDEIGVESITPRHGRTIRGMTEEIGVLGEERGDGKPLLLG